MNFTNAFRNFALLKQRDFRNYLSGTFFLTIGVQVQSVAVGWQVYELTRDPLWLGMIGLSEALPFILSTFPGGHVADTRKRKSILKWTISGYLFCSLVLWILSKFYLGWISSSGIWSIFLVIGLVGVMRGFAGPARSAFGFQLISKDRLPQAASISSTVWQAAAVLGPALGGFLYAWYGSTGAYLFTLFCIATSLLSYFLIKADPPPASQTTEPAITKVREGMKFFFNHPLILPAMSLDMLAVLLGGAVAVLPMFCDQVLFTGPTGLGILRAMPSFGAIIAGLFTTFLPITTNTGKKLLFSTAGFGVSMILFALSKNFYLSCFILALSGAFDMVSVVVRHTILQTYSPEEMRGRLSAINYIFVGTSNEIGAFESGLAAKLFGLVNSVVLGGFGTLLVTSAIGYFSRDLRELSLDKDISNDE
ncbi:MAG: MFS transporter [Bacteroidia bacterium]|nr:MFS transporter [Bacteroidia bacterium]